MTTIRDIVEAFGGPSKFAEATGAYAPTVRSWVFRNSLPSEWWGRTARAARKLRVRGVTLEALAEIAESQDAEAA